MAVSKAVLGMNARNYLYIKRYNKRKYKLLADDKLATKELLSRDGVPTTGLIAKFESLHDVRGFDWHSLPERFVLKPARGYGGRGIVVVRKWNGEEGVTNRGTTIHRSQLESEIYSILDGAYSLNNLPDTAFMEDQVRVHSFFKKMTEKGVPDIRVIVLNKVPVMAMLRLPTIFSDGKANLHLGAVGIGIDIRTGITTYGVIYDELISMIPGKKVKISGVKIPEWQKLLEIASRAQITSGLGFVGIDIVLDDKKGPLVLEVNARPGLAIQIANQDSLRTRLERVTGMDVPGVERAVSLAQTLFADALLEDVPHEENILNVIEKVTIIGTKKRKVVRAKIDTGAYRTALDIDLVHELGLDKHHKTIHVRAGSGSQRRETTKIRFKIRGKEIKTVATYSERGHMRFPVIIGRRDLEGFLVDPKGLPHNLKLK